jgi:hypothetical protein
MARQPVELARAARDSYSRAMIVSIGIFDE